MIVPHDLPKPRNVLLVQTAGMPSTSRIPLLAHLFTVATHICYPDILCIGAGIQIADNDNGRTWLAADRYASR